ACRAVRAVGLDPAKIMIQTAPQMREQHAQLVAVARWRIAVDRDHGVCLCLRRASHSCRVWPQTSTAIVSNGAGRCVLRNGREPSRRPTACDGALSGAMQWITSLHPSVSNAQSIAAVDPSVA